MITHRALIEAFLKFSPRHQLKNPVIFTVFVGALLTTGLFIQAVLGTGEAPAHFILMVMIFLWLTVFFANLAESAAESRGKAQADSLRKARRDIQAKKLSKALKSASFTLVKSEQLRESDIILVETGDFIPVDGEIIEGIASVNESAVTGESAPVIRENGGDRSSVTGGTQVISDWLIIRVTANPGETFLDRMIELVEGAKRQKTPNEIALNILLAALTIIFLLVCSTLLAFSIYSISAAGHGQVVTITVLVALFVCLAPNHHR